MHNIQHLRETLFDTLEKVKDGTLPLDRARVIIDTSQAIINSVKVEVEFVKTIRATKGTGFIEIENKK